MYAIVNKRLNTAAENLTTNKCKQVGHIRLKIQKNFAHINNAFDVSSKEFFLLSIKSTINTRIQRPCISLLSYYTVANILSY